MIKIILCNYLGAVFIPFGQLRGDFVWKLVFKVSIEMKIRVKQRKR